MPSRPHLKPYEHAARRRQHRGSAHRHEGHVAQLGSPRGVWGSGGRRASGTERPATYSAASAQPPPAPPPHPPAAHALPVQEGGHSSEGRLRAAALAAPRALRARRPAGQRLLPAVRPHLPRPRAGAGTQTSLATQRSPRCPLSPHAHPAHLHPQTQVGPPNKPASAWPSRGGLARCSPALHRCAPSAGAPARPQRAAASASAAGPSPRARPLAAARPPLPRRAAPTTRAPRRRRRRRRRSWGRGEEGRGRRGSRHTGLRRVPLASRPCMRPCPTAAGCTRTRCSSGVPGRRSAWRWPCPAHRAK